MSQEPFNPEILLEKISTIIKSKNSRDAKLLQICKSLESEIPYYNWVGFYLVEPEHPSELILGPYIGAPTEHVRIPFGKGICGQAASTKKTFLIQDVSKETNYLSCSIHVKSEIVIPILKDQKIVGELDIDSHATAPFTTADQKFLESICELLTKALFN
ncbi:GAF domain-containing protein [candidate division KSB1 bacterium]|nr:GAF domain-containing protein [candidate division KSB1 bacterium]